MPAALSIQPGRLAKPSATPTKVIQLEGAKYAGLAFDSSGDLSVDDYDGVNVVEYTKSRSAPRVPPPRRSSRRR